MGIGGKQPGKSTGSGLAPVMSPAETAQFLRISARTLANWRSSGRGPAIRKAGGRVAYQAASVLEWVQQQEIEGDGGEGLSKVRITTRPYPKNPKRLHVDIMFAPPHTPDRPIRRRLLAPDGMDSNTAEAWGRRQVHEILKELGQSMHAVEKENWDRGTMLIQRNVYRGLLQDSPKGEIGAVPMAPVLMRALRELYAEVGSRCRFVLSRFRAGRWTHCNETTLATRVQAIQRRAGVAPKGPRMHRHTALTLAARAGVPPLALQKLARHSRLETTMHYYIHIQDVEMAALAVAALDPSPAGSPGLVT